MIGLCFRAHFRSQQFVTSLAQVCTNTQVNRGSTFALRRSILDFCLGGQRSAKGIRAVRTLWPLEGGGETALTVSVSTFLLKSIIELFVGARANSQQFVTPLAHISTYI